MRGCSVRIYTSPDVCYLIFPITVSTRHQLPTSCAQNDVVDVTPCALGSAGDGTPWRNVGSRHRRDKRRIDSELRAVPQWEAICDNLDAPVINDGHIDIHVGHAARCGQTRHQPPGRRERRRAQAGAHVLQGRRRWRKPTGDPQAGQGDPGIRCAGQAAAASAGGGAGARGSGHWG